ncbi:sterol desaturase family protein [Rhizobium ruizarguesonis]|uniref:sterol desaturase family protein n=1 Tax=Rhizobium ruizarguesonis TaxID=2081791 RepID=UPI0013EE79C8|nr:sterol desaturase family protein [Rhizobium ruizarguesonis]
MHAVSHPFNAVLVQAFAIILPIWLMGYSPDTVLIFLVINAVHGIISHFNVDLRLGWPITSSLVRKCIGTTILRP